MTWAEVCQMVGRSCRRFGLCTGSVYVVSLLADSNDITTGGKQYLQRFDDQFDLDQGPSIAEHLVKKFNGI